MATQVPPKKNAAATLFVSLVSQANTKLFQVAPTLAAGDVKVSTDGGAFANLTTLPVVTPASGRAVKVDLSAAEMNGDNIVLQFVDAAGAEWCDLLLNLQTTTRQIDDIPTATDAADALLKRDMAAVTGEAARSPLNALRFLRNKWSVATGTLTVTKEDDTTTAWTAVTTGTAGADPITAVDPA